MKLVIGRALLLAIINVCGRVINRAPGLKLVVMTLLSSLRPIGNVVLICCTFFVIFGILGIQVIKNHKIFIDPKVSSLSYCQNAHHF